MSDRANATNIKQRICIKNNVYAVINNLWITRMWTNAQRDGHPAEYRWRPLFNAAKFG